jgi:hypothetical protein
MRRRIKTQADVDRYVKQGLGQGERESYQPWLRVQDVPSRGRSHKVLGSIVDRVYHLLSDLEYAFWLQLDFSENIVDIREQFPLFPVPALQAIASSKGIKYPLYVGTDVPFVMTTDFVITIREPDGSTRLVARTVKPHQEVTSGEDLLRTWEKLEIEEEYWRAQGVGWNVVTEQNLPTTVTRNLEWLRKGGPIHDRWEDEHVCGHFIAELIRAQYFGWTLGKTLRHVSGRLMTPYETCAQMFRYVVWQKLISIDLMQPISITGPFPEIKVLESPLSESYISEVV